MRVQLLAPRCGVPLCFVPVDELVKRRGFDKPLLDQQRFQSTNSELHIGERSIVWMGRIVCGVPVVMGVTSHLRRQTP
jgi:hypothetical protein